MLVQRFRHWPNNKPALGERIHLYNVGRMRWADVVQMLYKSFVFTVEGGRVVVSTAAFQARVRGSVPGLGGGEPP